MSDAVDVAWRVGRYEVLLAHHLTPHNYTLHILLPTPPTPHHQDPYIRLDGDVHWPFYVEFLLRWGIALKHPTKGDLIKLTEFHI